MFSPVFVTKISRSSTSFPRASFRPDDCHAGHFDRSRRDFRSSRFDTSRVSSDDLADCIDSYTRPVRGIHVSPRPWVSPRVARRRRVPSRGSSRSRRTRRKQRRSGNRRKNYPRGRFAPDKPRLPRPYKSFDPSRDRVRRHRGFQSRRRRHFFNFIDSECDSQPFSCPHVRAPARIHRSKPARSCRSKASRPTRSEATAKSAGKAKATSATARVPKCGQRDPDMTTKDELSRGPGPCSRHNPNASRYCSRCGHDVDKACGSQKATSADKRPPTKSSPCRFHPGPVPLAFSPVTKGLPAFAEGTAAVLSDTSPDVECHLYFCRHTRETCITTAALPGGTALIPRAPPPNLPVCPRGVSAFEFECLGATATYDHYAVVDLSVFPITASAATLVLDTVVRVLHSSFPAILLGTNDFCKWQRTAQPKSPRCSAPLEKQAHTSTNNSHDKPGPVHIYNFFKTSGSI